jgi:hypothetical protein
MVRFRLSSTGCLLGIVVSVVLTVALNVCLRAL